MSTQLEDKVNMKEFKGKVFYKIAMKSEFPDNAMGCAWSGISCNSSNQNSQVYPNNSVEFLYGTDNGQVIKVKIQSPQHNSLTNDLSHTSINSVSVSLLPLLQDSQRCFQVCQFEDCVLLSCKDQNQFCLKLFNIQNLTQQQEIRGSVSSYYFSPLSDNQVVYIDVLSGHYCPRLIFCKISNNSMITTKILQLFDNSQYPTTLMSTKQFLFIGLISQNVIIYNLLTSKIMRNISLDFAFGQRIRMTHYPKRLAAIQNSSIIAVISLKDYITIVHTISAAILQSFHLEQLFLSAKIDFEENYEIFVFSFVNSKVCIVGGNFGYLFFFEWKTLKIVKIHYDPMNFVGVFFHANRNEIYLTHEREPVISVLH